MPNLLQRIRFGSESRLTDVSGLVPDSEQWFAYLEDFFDRWAAGENPNFLGRFPLAVVDRIIERADERMVWCHEDYRQTPSPAGGSVSACHRSAAQVDRTSGPFALGMDCSETRRMGNRAWPKRELGGSHRAGARLDLLAASSVFAKPRGENEIATDTGYIRPPIGRLAPFAGFGTSPPLLFGPKLRD